ncbi:hypothetical protein GD627_05710 [Arthrobacter yangruifuii]|uniref:Membrane protein involved in the export of O-antigen and teichoic acid n=1 Tax=Arthrobacter yangruifuii TaxID=2606616 RepID=A0A5N6MU89_9MICC|nr:hypothetical protein [Arthrobacter yangruifuii]KAD4060527.1 hypothetical protein GD627_05710 [Arthrobacter yangruifuii]
MGQRTVRQHIRRLGAFGASVVITTLVGLLAIPVVIANAGSEAWGVIALGQSAALLFGVLVSFGWGTVGPAMVAGMLPEQRPQMFLDSLVSRVYLFVVTAPLAVLTVWLIAGGDSAPVAALACLAYLIPFLGASWFFVGDARPGRLLVFDTIPVTLGTVLGLVGLILTGDVFVYLAIQLAMNLLGVTVSALLIRTRSAAVPRLDVHPGRAVRRLAGQRHGVVTAATSSLYVNTPLLVVGAVLPGAVALYAMAEKFFKYGLTAVGPVVQVLQGSIADPDRALQEARIRVAAKWAPLAAAFCAAAMALCIPWASDLLSQGKIQVGFDLSVPMGVVFGAVTVSQVVGLACLIPLGEGKALAVSTVLGAAIGVPLIVAGALTLGVSAVAWAVAVSELAVAVYQLGVVRRYFRRSSRKYGDLPGTHTRVERP